MPITLCQLSLTPKEAEMLCSLDVSENHDAEVEKKQLAHQLSEAFAAGTEVIPDKWKANHYRKLAEEQALADDTYFKTRTFYEAASWFDSLRILAIRVMLAMRVFLQMASAAFSFVLSAIGLFAGARLAVDLGVVIKNLSQGESLKDILLKDGRLSRMLNDAIWFGVNMTAFCFSAGFSIFGQIILKSFLNMVGFSFDVAHEGFKWNEVTHCENLIKKLDARMNVIQDQVEFSKEYDKLNCFKNKLENKIQQIKHNRLMTIGVALAVCVGMGLVFFPPTSIAMIVGAAIVVAAGCIFSGFGKRIWDKFKANKASQLKESVMNDSALEKKSPELDSKLASILEDAEQQPFIPSDAIMNGMMKNIAVAGIPSVKEKSETALPPEKLPSSPRVMEGQRMWGGHEKGTDGKLVVTSSPVMKPVVQPLILVSHSI